MLRTGRGAGECFLWVTANPVFICVANRGWKLDAGSLRLDGKDGRAGGLRSGIFADASELERLNELPAR